MSRKRAAIKEQGGTVVCRVCGCGIVVKPGKGRVPETHTECGQFESALRRVERFLRHEVLWNDSSHQKRIKGDIIALLNQTCDARNTPFPQKELSFQSCETAFDDIEGDSEIFP